MKVSFQTGITYNKKANKPNFGSFRPEIDNYGEKKFNFYVPYNADKYSAELEIFEAKKQRGIWHADVNNAIKTIPMPQEGLSLSLDDILDFNRNHLAYRYKLTDKNNPNNVKYILDNGTRTEEKGDKNAANVLYTDRLIFNKPQNAILIMPDMFHRVAKEKYTDKTSVGIPKNTLRNHANKLGGNLQGIIAKIPELKEAGYTKIVGTPFTKDVVSSHKYWTQNAYQLDPTLGSEEDFEKLQQTLAANGIGWVADGAFVNEGLQGVHFKSFLKWGNMSPFKNWFYFSNNNLEPLNLGIFPENSQNVNFKLINFKYDLSQDENTNEIIVKPNEKYNPKKPTFVQFYDKRLVSDVLAQKDRIIEAYDKTDIDSNLDISRHDDVINPYCFEVNPEILFDNIVAQNKYIISLDKDKRPNLQDIETMQALFDSENFSLAKKKDAGGYIAWDGNADLPKMNLHASKADFDDYVDTNTNSINESLNERYKGFLQVKDYVANAGKYWTNKTKNIQTLYVAKQIGKTDNYMQRIDELINAGKLPESTKNIINQEIIDNIIANDYNLPSDYTKTKQEVIEEAIDSFPLDALGFSDELLASFSSPYISKRPFKADDLGKTRSEIAQNKYKDIPEEYRETYAKFDNILKTKLLKYIETALDEANKENGGKLYTNDSKNPTLTPFTTEAIKLLLPNMIKQALEMAIMINLHKKPLVSCSTIENVMEGVENVSPQQLGICAYSPAQEAKDVVEKVSKGLDYMNNPEVDAAYKLQSNFQIEISKLYRNADEKALKLAKVIVEKGDSGLGWRIDAAKDVSNMDAVRSGYVTFDEAWDNVIDVWSTFAQAVRQENPNAYMTAEITDLNSFINKETSKNAKYDTEEKAEIEFLEKTGITSFANYKYLYSAVPQLFHLSSEDGSGAWKLGIISSDINNPNIPKDKFREEKFISAWEGNRNFLEHGPYDAVKGSYTFYENHDKPRILHINALDINNQYKNLTDYNGNKYSLMTLFHDGFMNGTCPESARKIADDVFSEINKNLTVYDYATLNPKAVAMAARLNMAVENFDDEFKNNFKKATAQLASGSYKGNSFEAAAFGVRPFDIVLKQVFEQIKYNGGKINDEEKTYKNILTSILKPACDDAYKMYKYMITLPGMVTDFAGHKQGATGYESKSNNIYQQNRNAIHWEWTSNKKQNENIECVKEFEQKMNELLKLRSDKNLSALNDGDTVLLPYDGQNQNIMGLFRYNDKGSKVITIYNPNGNGSVRIGDNRIILNNDKEGITGGLKPGTTFVNADSSDKCVYKVMQYDNGHCFIAKFWNEKDYNNEKNKPMPRFLDIEISPNDGNVLILKCIDDTQNQTKEYSPSFCGLAAMNSYKNTLKRTNLNQAQIFSKIS